MTDNGDRKFWKILALIGPFASALLVIIGLQQCGYLGKQAEIEEKRAQREEKEAVEKVRPKLQVQAIGVPKPYGSKSDAYISGQVIVSNPTPYKAVNITFDTRVNYGEKWLDSIETWRRKARLPRMYPPFELVGPGGVAFLPYSSAIASDPISTYCDQKKTMTLRIILQWKNIYGWDSGVRNKDFSITCKKDLMGAPFWEIKPVDQQKKK